MRRPWFWATLAFWTVFSASLAAWALIFAPLAFDPKCLGHFQTRVNGMPQDHEFWVNEGRLNRLLPVIEARYQKDGWRPLGAAMDLAPALLGIQDTRLALPDSLQVKLFQRGGDLRALGLWQDPQGDRTYGWTCQMPNPRPSGGGGPWDLPFVPPPDATASYLERFQRASLGVILAPPRGADWFEAACRAQGFTERPLDQGQASRSYLIQKGPRRLIARFTTDAQRSSLALLELEAGP